MKNFMHGLYVIPYFGLISDPESEISILPFLEMPFLDEAVEVYIKVHCYVTTNTVNSLIR